MTINVRFGLADSGQNSWEKRKASFLALFDAYRPDFIAMQEVNHFQADFFQTHLREYHYIGKREPAPPFWQDVLIFYKKHWYCQDSQRFFLSDTPDVPSRLSDSKWPRQCVMGRFRRENRQVICVNTHFDFADNVQQKSARLILKRLSRFSRRSLPQILFGDFNAVPGNNCYDIFMRSGDTTSPFADVFDAGATGTFHNFTGEPVGGRVDWILWRGQARLLDQKIITEQLAGRYPSDHFPVYAFFQLPPSDVSVGAEAKVL